MKDMGTDGREKLVTIQYSLQCKVWVFSPQEAQDKEWEKISSCFWQPGILFSPEGGKVSLKVYLYMF